MVALCGKNSFRSPRDQILKLVNSGCQEAIWWKRWFHPKTFQNEKKTHTFYSTSPKINIEPETDGLEDDFPFPGGPYSQVPAVNLPGCTLQTAH